MGLGLAAIISSLIAMGGALGGSLIGKKGQQDAINNQQKTDNIIANNEQRVGLENQLNTNTLDDAYKARLDNVFARCGGAKKVACGGSAKRKCGGKKTVSGGYYDRNILSKLR